MVAAASRRLLAGALVALATAIPHAPSADASISKDQRRCQAGAAKAGVKRFAAEARALADCLDAVGRGELPVETDCTVHAPAAGALGVAASRAETAIRKACAGDDIVASLRYAGACEQAATVDALVACLGDGHSARSAGFVTGLYDDDALPADSAARACRERVSREGRKLAAKGVRTLLKCKDLASKYKRPARARCEDDAKVQATFDKLAAKFVKVTAKHCDAPALAGAAFGTPCAGASSTGDLATCLLDGVEAMLADVAPALYGDGGNCGDIHNAIEGRIVSLLGEMSLTEKIRQMHGAGIAPSTAGWPTITNTRLGIPRFWMIDGPRGVAKQSGNATAFPVGMSRGASWDPDLEERIGEAIAVEARAKGASVLLAPVTTIVRHPRWGRSQETYGEDQVLLGEMGTAFVRGAQRHLLASVKHYALNSIEDTRYDVSVNIDERTMREIYLPHFQKVVQEGQVASVMTSYNRVNGAYCAENAPLVRDILKDEWGFRGFVESDWIQGTRSTVPSALAGLDIEMPEGVFFAQNVLRPAVEGGDVPMSVIDEAVSRILRMKFCFGLDTNPSVFDPSLIETAEHLALAREAAVKGTVLLKNTDALLPLTDPPAGTVAVIGPLADVENIGDSGSSDVNPSEVVTVLEGLLDRLGPAAVVHVTGDPNEMANAAALAAADAVVVVVGFTEADEGETFVGAGDRDLYDLPADQQQLLQDVASHSDAVVVILEGGSTIGVEGWVDDVEALLHAWYPGAQGGHAIADLLFGDANPSGKLPLTLAADESDLPEFLNNQLEVTYDAWHGYRLLDRDGIEPRYPFGFGLSYTTFAYSNLQLADDTLAEGETLTVTFDVTNTGARAGEEVVQLYVSYPGSGIERPVQDLKAFARVALEPAEAASVTLEVPVQDLAWWDIGLPGWAVEHIQYGVHVGGSSRDLPLSATFDVVP